MSKIRILATYILLWLTIYLPVYSFRKALKLQITDFTGLYDDAMEIDRRGSTNE
ncbi:hypothetical protein [Olivibacter sp. SDN3]|uniref:hypothetical protein n=1 Tax=Olivibacter sp. SDN3 TaxID=2764720 RepID=UPI001C9E6565|nr:hypothetical protein [Olivibacter sp. SDN3]